MKKAVLVIAAAACLAFGSSAAAFDHFNNFNLSGNASAGAQPNTPLDASISLEATMGTTLDTHAAATATLSIPGIPYVAKAQPVPKGVGVVKIRFSVLCGASAAGTVKVNQVVARMYDSANQEILTANSPENVSLTFTCPAAGSALAPRPAAKPDLVITNFGLEKNANCSYTFSVGVTNNGTASWSAKEPVVVVKDMHAGVLDAWGTGVGIDPPIAVGETRHLHVTVAPYGANPNHMATNAPHPFRATVNENHLVDESNFSNNEGPGPATWNGMKVIMMGEPNGCGRPLAPSTRPLGAGIAPTPAPTPVVPR